MSNKQEATYGPIPDGPGRWWTQAEMAAQEAEVEELRAEVERLRVDLYFAEQERGRLDHRALMNRTNWVLWRDRATVAEARLAEAWDEGHQQRWRRGPDDCDCCAYSAGECACGRYGTGELLSLNDNPYRTALAAEPAEVTPPAEQPGVHGEDRQRECGCSSCSNPADFEVLCDACIAQGCKIKRAEGGA